MRQNQKVLKKGDYYQLQVQQQTTIKQDKAARKQQFPSTLSIPGSDQIVTQIPNYAEARSAYFCVKTKSDFSKSGFQQLQEQLQTMLKQEQDQSIKKQIQALIKQIQIQKQHKVVPLNNLSSKKQNQKNAIKKLQLKEVQLLMKLDFQSIQDKLSKLEQLNYPEISQLQSLLQIMLGQRAVNPNTFNSATTTLMNLDQKTKQDIQALYTHFSSLSCLNNIYNLIEDLHRNDGKAIQMNQWIKKTEEITQINQDFNMELEADQKLVQQLRTNFNANIKTIKGIIQGYKDKIKK